MSISHMIQEKDYCIVYKYTDAAVKIWTDKMKFGGKLTDEEIDAIFAYADAANNDNLIESLDKYF